MQAEAWTVWAGFSLIVAAFIMVWLQSQPKRPVNRRAHRLAKWLSFHKGIK